MLLTAPAGSWLLQGAAPHERNHPSLLAFFNERNMVGSCARPVIETSFLLAPPRHPLIKAWLDELIAALAPSNGSSSTSAAS